jgi:hypothetical protein
MLPTDKIKTTKFRPSLLGVNPKPAADIYPIYPFTALQQSEKLLDPLVFISKQ